MSALPTGSQCYQAKLKQETTLSLTPEEIHEIGLRYIENLKKEIAEIGERNMEQKRCLPCSNLRRRKQPIIFLMIRIF